MSKNMHPLDKSLLPWIGKTTKALDHFITEMFASNGIQLTKAQFILLRVLSKHEGIKQNDLASFASREKTTLARLLTTMEKKNLVYRKGSDTDKRTNLVFISPQGKEELDRALPALVESIQLIQSGITKEELSTTLGVLQRIRENINADEFLIPCKH
ncbi:hypothetical protein BFP72_03075 [Reichenbachiella sp. 5M10]|nr:hypothetical protein BFP72_03075 [Reichenbachiella sp. 5M10]